MGREGTAPARRARGDRREFRAHPSLQSGRHGRAAAAIPTRRKRRGPRPHGQRDLYPHGPRRAHAESAARGGGARHGGSTKRFTVQSRIDTANEIEYIRHGGILPYVLRQALTNKIFRTRTPAIPAHA